MADSKAVKEIVEMGFSREKAEEALKKFNGNTEAALNYIITEETEAFETYPVDNENFVGGDQTEGGLNEGRFEPLNPEQRQREIGVPLGVKNIGKNDYFNSLLQTYFKIPELVSFVFEHTEKENPLIEELQKIFALMIRSDRKYLDPSEIQKLSGEIGACEKPLGEFNVSFLQKIEQNIGGFEGKFSSLFKGSQVSWSISDQTQHEFSFIPLDINNKDLYTAWDSTLNTEEVDTCIERLPPTLLFEIKRFKHEKNELQKSHKPFLFSKMIYPDRFLTENRPLCLTLREKLLDLRKNCELLEDHLEKFNRFEQSESSLVSLLQKMGVLLSMQTEGEIQSEEGVDLYSTNNLLSPEYSEPLLNIIENYLAEVQSKVEDMQEQLSSHKKEIEDIFDRPELTRTPYQLHSILIHEGGAGYGEYYAFIHDIREDVWRKYSDIHVTVVPEETVMNEAIGGYGHTSAFALVYITSDIMEIDYESILPERWVGEIEEDNSKFREEIEEYKLNTALKTIQETYSLRHMQTTAQANNRYYILEHRKPEPLRHELINFDVHLKIRLDDQIMKWHILDNAIKEFDGRGIDELDPQEPFYIKLNSHFKKACKDAPYHLTLTTYDRNKLGRELEAFKFNYHDASVLSFVYRKLNQNFYELAFYGIQILLLEKRVDTEYIRWGKEVNKILILRLTGEVIKQIYQSNLDEAIRWGWFLVMLTSMFVLRNDSHFFAIKRRMNEIIEMVGEPEEFKQMLKALDSGEYRNCVDKERIPEELELLLEEVGKFEGYEWIEGWKKENLATEIVLLREETYENLKDWVGISEKISRYQSVTLGEYKAADENLLIVK